MSSLPIVRAPAWDDSLATWRAITRSTVLTVSVLLLVTTVSFAVRRVWIGNSLTAVSGAWLALGTFGLVALAAVQRVLWADSRVTPRDHGISNVDFFVSALSSAYVIVGGLTLGSLAEGLGWQILIAIFIIAEEAWAFRRTRADLSEPRSPAASAAAVLDSPRTDTIEMADESQDEELLDEEDAPWLPSGVTQQLTRGVDAARGEYVVGVLTVDFAPGQRTEILHVAFCPPLARPPRIQIQPVDGPPLTATVGQAETFGARFELRLARAWEEPQRAVVQFETQEQMRG